MIGGESGNQHSENEGSNGDFHNGDPFVAPYFLLLVESTKSSRFTHRHRRCAVAHYHGGSWGRCDRLGGQHVVGSEASNQHSENEDADCSVHGRVSFSYYVFEFAA